MRVETVSAAFASLAFCFAMTKRAEACARGVELDLRDSTYVFGVPNGSLGAWKSEKVDVAACEGNDLLLLHAVSTNRIEPSGGTHGEFARIQDDHRFGAATIRLATGVGGGVLGQRTVTLAIAQALPGDRRIALTAGIDLTSLAPDDYQRVVGLGPEIVIGRVGVSARYYHATATKLTKQPPSSQTLVVSAPVMKNLGLSVFANFGGEVNGDRTSAFLPTSSGRYGTDLSLGARVGIGTGTSVLATYEGAAYRNTLTRALSRVQHTITIGIALTRSTPKESRAAHEGP